MCGIFGAINKFVPDHYQNLVLKHRGPDGYGLWKHDNLPITFGHRRLSILDLSDNGKQPMHGWGLTITLNGEIYNFIELRNELISNGYSFSSNTDTEVVLAAYHKWGKQCVHRFNGMWSLAIWDENNQNLFLSRDRFGKKPLFYYQKDNQFIFASEMKGLFPFMDVVKENENFETLKEQVFTYENTEHCLIEGIKRFPAGSNGYFSITSNVLTIEKYWNVLENLVEVPKKYDDQVEVFRELFFDACRLRMRSDVPIGTALSGGVDSTAVICAINHVAKSSNERMSKNWQNAFVASFPGSFNDETKYAKEVIDYLEIPGNYIQIDPLKAIDTFFESIYLYEDIYPTSPFPMMQTYEGIKNGGVSVSLDGHGADELLSGYGTDLLLTFLDAGVNIKKINNTIRTYNETCSVAIQNNQIAPMTMESYWKYMVSHFKGRKDTLKFYGNDLLNSKKENPSKGIYGAFNTQLFEEFNETIMPTLLRGYDRYSMSASVEIRMPFMDHRLVSFCHSLPWTSKVRGGYTKAILRDALEPYTPKDIIRRKSKIGFNTPMIEWMRNEWKPFLSDIVHSSDFLNCRLINGKALQLEYQNVLDNKHDSYYMADRLWTKMYPYFWEKAMLKNNYWKLEESC